MAKDSTSASDSQARQSQSEAARSAVEDQGSIAARQRDNFRLNLRVLREASGYSQAEMARRVAVYGPNFHQQTVHGIEQGDRGVRIEEAIAIALALGASIDQMLEPTSVNRASNRRDAVLRRLHAHVSDGADLLREQAALAAYCDRLIRSGDATADELSMVEPALEVTLADAAGDSQQLAREDSEIDGALAAVEAYGAERRPFSAIWLRAHGYLKGGDDGVDREGE